MLTNNTPLKQKLRCPQNFAANCNNLRFTLEISIDFIRCRSSSGVMKIKDIMEE